MRSNRRLLFRIAAALALACFCAAFVGLAQCQTSTNAPADEHIANESHHSPGVIISVMPSPIQVVPNGFRTLYANVTGASNETVRWESTCGTLDGAKGASEKWTAPAIPGACTITARPITDDATSATVTANVVAANTTLSVVPFYMILYKGQYALLQSMLLGNGNAGVNWVKSGGTFIGKTTDRAIGFMADQAGTYAVTATSVADPRKSTTATIVVTDHRMPETATANETEPVDCSAVGKGKTYEVGSETDLDRVPWNTLSPGSTIRIHPGIYHRQIQVVTQGKATQPIRICGVPDSKGNLPVIDGADAYPVSSVTSKYQQPNGVVVIANTSDYWGNAYPRFIIIEGLNIQHGTGGADWDRDGGGWRFHANAATAAAQSPRVTLGTLVPYSRGSACIRITNGSDIVLRGNELSFCGNNLFTRAQTPESAMVRNVLIQGNNIHDGGVPHSDRQHSLYLEHVGSVVQFNHLGAPAPYSNGSNFKTRCVQQFIRFNYIANGAHTIDMVEPEDFPDYVKSERYASYHKGNPRDPVTLADVASVEQAYQSDYVYGNLIYSDNFASGLIHYGYDGSGKLNHPGSLWLYYNTFYFPKGRRFAWRFAVLKFTDGGETEWQDAKLLNNAIWLAKGQDNTESNFYWAWGRSNRIMLGKNWIASTWGTGNPDGGDGTGLPNGQDKYPYPTGNSSLHITGMANLVMGSSSPFDLASYVPLNPSALHGAEPLPHEISDLPVMFEYDPIAHMMKLRRNQSEMGARGSQ